MVCALGLRSCGDVARSEDLAQEVFVVAWKQLPELREPEKLRGWLGGIARNLRHNALRHQQRAPLPRGLDGEAVAVDHAHRVERNAELVGREGSGVCNLRHLLDRIHRRRASVCGARSP